MDGRKDDGRRTTRDPNSLRLRCTKTGIYCDHLVRRSVYASKKGDILRPLFRLSVYASKRGYIATIVSVCLYMRKEKGRYSDHRVRLSVHVSRLKRDILQLPCLSDRACVKTRGPRDHWCSLECNEHSHFISYISKLIKKHDCYICGICRKKQTRCQKALYQAQPRSINSNLACLGKGCGDLASWQVSLNFVQRFQRRSRKCIHQ